ncbi:MAG TPA: NAD-dependent epimerase/dehydratase family protein [Verrucomicrobiae bacterium]|jgi:UDP-glucose 4-epimerase|nr:NAD-dependent epimerase/dehydratase family protein [Verrucomicrobiae bacterium]
MKILVTGGAGFIGSHIVEHFQGKAEVRVLDNLRSGFKKNLAGLKHEFIEASILDREAVRRALEGVDYVFHLAAMISVPESMQKPIECNELNTTGTLVVLEEAARAGVKKLVFSTSAAIYGDNPTVPKLENMLPEPKSPYAITKLDGEFYCKMFSDEGRLETTCLRYFNVFGPRQDPKSQYAAAVPIFIDRALKNEPITIYGDGEQTRDFIYVKDVVAANVFFATQSNETGVFNVASGKRITVSALAKTICELTGSRSAILYAPERAGDVKHSCASVDKISGKGFVPVDNRENNLRATIEFFRDGMSKGT